MPEHKAPFILSDGSRVSGIILSDGTRVGVGGIQNPNRQHLCIDAYNEKSDHFARIEIDGEGNITINRHSTLKPAEMAKELEEKAHEIFAHFEVPFPSAAKSDKPPHEQPHTRKTSSSNAIIIREVLPYIIPGIAIGIAAVSVTMPPLAFIAAIVLSSALCTRGMMPVPDLLLGRSSLTQSFYRTIVEHPYLLIAWAVIVGITAAVAPLSPVAFVAAIVVSSSCAMLGAVPLLFILSRRARMRTAPDTAHGSDRRPSRGMAGRKGEAPHLRGEADANLHATDGIESKQDGPPR